MNVVSVTAHSTVNGGTSRLTRCTSVAATQATPWPQLHSPSCSLCTDAMKVAKREAHTHSVQRRDTRVKQPPLDGRNQIDAHRRLMIVVISQESLPNVMIGRPQQYLLPQLDVQSAAQLCMLCRALWPP